MIRLGRARSEPDRLGTAADYGIEVALPVCSFALREHFFGLAGGRPAGRDQSEEEYGRNQRSVFCPLHGPRSFSLQNFPHRLNHAPRIRLHRHVLLCGALEVLHLTDALVELVLPGDERNAEAATVGVFQLLA